MVPELPSAQSATPLHAGFAPAERPGAWDEQDVALGCECANPALQIDAWNPEAPATAAD